MQYFPIQTHGIAFEQKKTKGEGNEARTDHMENLEIAMDQLNDHQN
jgi:hypothetical protein